MLCAVDKSVTVFIFKFIATYMHVAITNLYTHVNVHVLKVIHHLARNFHHKSITHTLYVLLLQEDYSYVRTLYMVLFFVLVSAIT